MIWNAGGMRLAMETVVFGAKIERALIPADATIQRHAVGIALCEGAAREHDGLRRRW